MWHSTPRYLYLYLSIFIVFYSKVISPSACAISINHINFQNPNMVWTSSQKGFIGYIVIYYVLFVRFVRGKTSGFENGLIDSTGLRRDANGLFLYTDSTRKIKEEMSLTGSSEHVSDTRVPPPPFGG